MIATSAKSEEHPLLLWQVIAAELEEIFKDGDNFESAFPPPSFDVSDPLNQKKKDEYDKAKTKHLQSRLALQEFPEAKSAYEKAKADYDATFEKDEEERKPSKAILEEVEKVFRTKVVAVLHVRAPSAICFSGGGIRSATFALGVLQELARRSNLGEGHDSKLGILSKLDYMSTVSGGGYLGAWFSAWAMKKKDGAERVIRKLMLTPHKKLDPERGPILHLRKFSAYLSPRWGALSADTWTLVSTVLRNIVINWMVLIPVLACVLCLPMLLKTMVESDLGWCASQWLVKASVGLAGFAIVYVLYDLPNGGNAKKRLLYFLLCCLLPLALSSFFFIIGMSWQWRQGADYSFWHPVGVCLGIAGVADLLVLGRALFRQMPESKKTRVSWPVVWGGIVASGITAFLVGLFSHLLWTCLKDLVADSRLYIWLGAPSVFAVFGVAAALFVATSSRVASDEDREWCARSEAWMLLVPVMWLIFAGLTVYASVIQGWLYDRVVTGLATLSLGGFASWLGYSPKSKASGKQEAAVLSLPGGHQITSWLGPLVALLFLALLTVVISATNMSLVRLLTTLLNWPSLTNSMTMLWLVYALALWGIALLTSIAVDPNKFSLHAMYRSRLIRAYLGASRSSRKPHPFTGFDPKDNFPIAELTAGRPFHLVNMALNLVATDNLAWQQRKAESFTASHLHCGSCRVGYRPSGQYGHPDGGMTLGGAITISGAAASPNMGYHSSPLLTIVMTLFNARLGAWLANPGEPGRKVWGKSGPTKAIRAFTDEAFGFTNDKNKWVYLSDGGHFENLGLYEMVLRRCHYIVVVDASADPHFAFEDLGNAVRKIRIDLGIPIEFPKGLPTLGSPPHMGKHCAIGEIQYHCVDTVKGAAPDNGILIYIKPSLNGNEPPDVAHYASQNPAFPHESTADQFFNEAQLESYRRLGSHVIEEICGKITTTFSDLKALQNQVEHYLWYSPSATISRSFTHHAQAYDALVERLRLDPNLSCMDNALFPELKKNFGTELASILRRLNPLNDQQERSIFFFCNSLIQLMENVYLDLNLEENQSDPHNQGWMTIFRSWFGSKYFQDAWQVSASTYGRPFKEFCDRELANPK